MGEENSTGFSFPQLLVTQIVYFLLRLYGVQREHILNKSSITFHVLEFEDKSLHGN